MKQPKYEPLKMGNKEFADNYGKRCMKYDKLKFNKELEERRKLIKKPINLTN